MNLKLKHYIATHTFHSAKVRKEFEENSEEENKKEEKKLLQ